jgi:hypothetical protein
LKYLKTFNETIYYHGTTLPISNSDIEEFKVKTGYRGNSILGTNREVKKSFDDMWDLLDDDEISNIIINSGYDAVKIIEEGGTSLAIHISKVNDIIKKNKND